LPEISEVEKTWKRGRGWESDRPLPPAQGHYYLRRKRFLVDDYGRMHVRWKFLSHTTVAAAECYPAGMAASKYLKRIEKKFSLLL
jgi:hypothetical protein